MQQPGQGAQAEQGVEHHAELARQLDPGHQPVAGRFQVVLLVVEAAQPDVQERGDRRRSAPGVHVAADGVLAHRAGFAQAALGGHHLDQRPHGVDGHERVVELLPELDALAQRGHGRPALADQGLGLAQQTVRVDAEKRGALAQPVERLPGVDHGVARIAPAQGDIGVDGGQHAAALGRFAFRAELAGQPGVGLGLRRLPAEVEGPGLVAGQVAVCTHELVRQLVEPAAQLGQFSARQDVVGEGPEQPHRRGKVAGRQRVPDRFFLETVGLVPFAGLQVLPALFRGVGLRAQEIGEQLMVAIPVPRLVEPEQEHVGLLQVIELAPAVASPGHGVAQRRAQAIQPRGAPEEVLHCRRLPAEYLFGQVFEHVPVLAAERGDPLREARHRVLVGRVPKG